MESMAAPIDDWRSPENRQVIIQKLEESIKALGNTPTNIQNNPIELEKAFFDKSKSKEEYMTLIHNVILMLSRQKTGTHHQGPPLPPQPNPMMTSVRPNPSMMSMGPGQPMGMNQPAPGYQSYNQYNNMGAPNQAPNPSYPPPGNMGVGPPQRMPQPPQYHSGMYTQGGNSAMHLPQQPRYPSNMAMPHGYPQQGHPMPTSNYPGPHNMGMMGGGGGYNSGGMSTHYNQPPMMRDRPVPHGPMMRPMISGPMRTSMMGYRQAMPGQMPMQSNQPSFMVDGVGVQPVHAVPNPSFASSIRPASVAYTSVSGTSTGSQLTGQQGPVPSPYSTITSSSASTSQQIPQTSMPPSSIPSQIPSSGGGPDTQHQIPPVPGASSVTNPPTPLAPSLQGPVPSPAPPTPLYPASPATSGIGSPATQPTMTPEENEAYIRKLGELQKYIPLMSKWINKLSKDDRKSDQYLKLKSLYNLLHDSNKRVPLMTLMKCGTVLERMFDNPDKPATKENSDSSNTNPPRNPTQPPTSASPITNEPVVPEPKFSSPPQSQSLLDFKMVHSPPPTYANLKDTIQPHPLPVERLPSTKKFCKEFELPPNLRREFAHLQQFTIDVLPKNDKYDKSITLLCSLENVGLPEVPSITVVLPPKYPSISPTCDLTHYQTNPSPFIKQVGMLLSEKLSKKTCVYPLTAILDNWELSILRVISEELNSDDDEDD